MGESADLGGFHGTYYVYDPEFLAVEELEGGTRRIHDTRGGGGGFFMSRVTRAEGDDGRGERARGGEDAALTFTTKSGRSSDSRYR
jgi:hypothetical protein